MTVHPGASFFPSGDLKTRLHFGRPARDVLVELIDGPWTLVISEGGLRRCNDLGLFGHMHPPDTTVIVPRGLLTLLELAAAWRPGPPNVIGVGAGSALDAAKLIRFASLEGTFPRDRSDWKTGQETGEAGLICVPTTAGSGSELTATASLWDESIKSSIDGPALQPSDAVYDPALLASADSEIQTAALWDAMAHALEALWSRKATALSDRYASFALKTMTQALDRSTSSSDRILSDLALGSAAAGAAISITRTGIAHALSYPLTGRHGLRHGLAAGLYAVAVASCLSDIDTRRAARIAHAFDTTAGAMSDVLAQLWRATGADRLAAAAAPPDAIVEQAGQALDPERANLSVIPPEPDIVVEICRRAADLACLLS
jgi:alcohol dehydrogenase class IV